MIKDIGNHADADDTKNITIQHIEDAVTNAIKKNELQTTASNLKAQ